MPAGHVVRLPPGQSINSSHDFGPKGTALSHRLHLLLRVQQYLHCAAATCAKSNPPRIDTLSSSIIDLQPPAVSHSIEPHAPRAGTPRGTRTQRLSASLRHHGAWRRGGAGLDRSFSSQSAASQLTIPSQRTSCSSNGARSRSSGRSIELPAGRSNSKRNAQSPAAVAAAAKFFSRFDQRAQLRWTVRKTGTAAALAVARSAPPSAFVFFTRPEPRTPPARPRAGHLCSSVAIRAHPSRAAGALTTGERRC